MPQRAGLSTGTGISTRLISEREDRLTTLYVTLSDAGGSVPSGTFLWAGLKFSISGAGGRVEKPVEVEENKDRSKSEHSAKRGPGSGRFFMKFRGPQALPNRPQSAMGRSEEPRA